MAAIAKRSAVTRSVDPGSRRAHENAERSAPPSVQICAASSSSSNTVGARASPMQSIRIAGTAGLSSGINSSLPHPKTLVAAIGGKLMTTKAPFSYTIAGPASPALFVSVASSHGRPPGPILLDRRPSALASQWAWASLASAATVARTRSAGWPPAYRSLPQHPASHRTACALLAGRSQHYTNACRRTTKGRISRSARNPYT